MGRHQYCGAVVADFQYEFHDVVGGLRVEIARRLVCQNDTRLVEKRPCNGNALFNGRYCVVNDKMVEGLDINDLCIVANTADEMKTVVSDLMTKPFVEEQVEIRKSRMDAFYNPSRATDKLVELLG